MSPQLEAAAPCSSRVLAGRGNVRIRNAINTLPLISKTRRLIFVCLAAADRRACVCRVNAVLDLNEGVLFVSLRIPDVHKRSTVLLAVDQTASGARRRRNNGRQ